MTYRNMKLGRLTAHRPCVAYRIADG